MNPASHGGVRRIGSFARGAAWVLGPLLLLIGVIAAGRMVALAARGRWDDAWYLAGGAWGIVLGPLLIQAARTGRDTATDAVHGLLRRARLIR
ncbi:hypothetical protein [Longimicrobium sp.]|uniref:hypothetical protein n=1 Tax=Longimicrobium sp. TaxID=2029185 RepID=UPI002E33AFD7|nr:hypothetical protein [Longimicrobium sp.]HEX6040218.1 hypothetical protein [Longimicrobium sp.]